MTIRDSLIAISVLLLALGGCAQKTASTEQPAVPAASAPAAEQPAAQGQTAPPGAAPAGPAPRSVGKPVQSTTASGSVASMPQSVDEFVDEKALRDVFFDSGHADVGRNGTRIMRDNARWVAENPSYLVLIEGPQRLQGQRRCQRCDERAARQGGRELSPQGGLAETRLWTISYSSAACPEKTDACAAKNRRRHFRVKKP